MRRRRSKLLVVGLCLAVASAAGMLVPGQQGAPRRSIDELLLFFPSKYPEGDWTPPDLEFQDVHFAAEDGTRLHAWYCPCEKPRAFVLIAHGNAGHVASRAPWLAYLQSRARVATFMFDYRGYGKSRGKASVQGALQDARAARAKFRQLAGITDADMLLMGESLGGAIVVQLAAESAPQGLILQSTFSSLREVAAVHYAQLSWLVPKDKLNSTAAVTRYRGPLLQSHGSEDRVVPLPLAESLFRSANEPKQFVLVPGAGHNDWLNDQYLAELDGFFNRLAPRDPR